MIVKNSLFKDIEKIENDEYKKLYDAQCKKILSEKAILARIMKECVAEFKDYDVDEIAERYIIDEPVIAGVNVHMDESVRGDKLAACSVEDTSIDEGTVTYDIRFTAIVPEIDEKIRLILNLEAQNDFYPGYPIIKRGIYYCSRLISSQYGTEFSSSHYEEIKKVYSIWICSNPPENRKNTINSYSITEKQIIGKVQEKVENYDLMTAVMICLGDDNDNSEGIIRMLEVLFSVKRKADEKKNILENEFSLKMTKNMEGGISDMCNLSEGVEAYGHEQGLEQGRLEERLKSLRAVIKNSKCTIDEAMDILEFPEEIREEYKKKLEA